MIKHPKQITPKYVLILQIIICLLLLGLAIFMSLPAMAQANTLRIVRVGAPDINCVFDQDCTITVADTSAEILFSNATGSGFLQSRTFPQGEERTQAEGLYAYLYRVDLRNLQSTSQTSCILSLRMNFGPLVPLDYNGDQELDDLFVVVDGGLGTVAPSAATRVGDTINISFGNGVCGEGPNEFSVAESTFFFGLTSRRANRPTVAQVQTTNEQSPTLDLAIRTPQLTCERLTLPTELQGAKLIDFDDVESGTVLKDLYRQQFGVSFEATDFKQARITDSAFGAASAPNVAVNEDLSQTLDNQPMLIQFDNPQTHVGFYIGNGDGDAVTGNMVAYTAEGKPICAFVYPFVPRTHQTFAGIYNVDGLISAVSLDYGQTRNEESIDDLYFVAAPQPDLIIESVSLDSIISRTLTFSYTVTNIGDAPIDLAGSDSTLNDNVSIRALLSQDEVYNEDEDFLVGTARLPEIVLAPGESVSRQIETTPDADPYAYQFFTLKVDATEVAQESNEENNIKTVAIEPPLRPDLIVESLTVDSIMTDTISYSYVIKNIGEGSIDLDGPTDSLADDVSIQAFLSQDEIFNNEGDSPAGGKIVGAGILAPTESFSGTFTSSTQVAPATFAFLTLMVDWGEVAIESNEENNTIATVIEPPMRIRVCREENNECVGQPDALLYRIMADIAISETMPLDENGYAINPGLVTVGEEFWAMQEISQTGPLADVGSARLYHTSGLTPTTVLSDTFENGNVLHLYISDESPLMVRDLVVSAQWTPTENADYQAELTENLLKTSDFFHDFTDGQFALGNITVYQNYDEWESADVWLHADNNQRPLAVVGGMVEEITVDISPTIPLTYNSGQIYMGAQWNRYFEPPGDPDIPPLPGNPEEIEPGADIRDDWALALAHELGHYSLFLWDTYFGLFDAPVPDGQNPADPPKKEVQQVNGCTGSAMGYLYEPENTEFIFKPQQWMDNCSETHAYSQTQGQRTEWDTIEAWYPWAVQPTRVMTDTPPLPIDLTTISFIAPTTPTMTLLDQSFDLLYVDEEDASDRARAYLIRGDRIIEQGQPAEDSTEIELIGAAVDDRFCLFDIKNVVPADEFGSDAGAETVDADTSLRHQYGCKVIDAAANEENELALEKDILWEPVIELDFLESIVANDIVISQTVNLRVKMPDVTDITLQAKFYPEHKSNPTLIDPFTFNETQEFYSATVSLPGFTPSLYLQLWVTDDPEGDTDELNPRREAIVGSGVKGAVVPGPARFGGGAPIISPKGDLIIIFNEAVNLGVGEFIAIQETYAIPPLPTNTTPLNNISGYRLTALPNSLITDGSVSLRYLPSSPLDGGRIKAANMDQELPDLSIYYWDGEQWSALDTAVSVEPDGYILANSPLKQVGIYALLENVIPGYEPVVYLPMIAQE